MRAPTIAEVFLVLKEFNPSFSQGGDMDMNFLAGAPIKELRDIGAASDAKTKGSPKGFEVEVRSFSSINGRMLLHGDPIQVRLGERVLFHVLNASATEIRSLALPGHVFRIVALVMAIRCRCRLRFPSCGSARRGRISAIVEMKHPGVWVMGDLADDDRRRGMGIVVEYAGRSGKPLWVKPKPFTWDYARFGNSTVTPAAPHRDHRNDLR